ncbi:LysM domain-containing protein [Pseudarthrobacter sp. PH31-O2]|uniref:LysM peptidoglycan-binding domain-containing protein n=1 Tax=Pseudarthrobacter sp. PH31-O2 TaxID=3046206 RepID=UPI0024BA07A8|nr:LysM domain-containing protein [Pseudarthrobacter sp. PH31-O2]MDJ0351142.1 LysM domain-containing protein [Pseudarthrobacter sp. PH31-O2]
MAAADVPTSSPHPALRADVVMAAAILLLGFLLAATGGAMVQRWRVSSAHHASLGFEDQLGAAANTAGLVVILWWAMSLGIAVAAALLERGGKVRAASATGRFAPGFMRRLALAAVGLQLLTAPLATAAVPPAFPDPAASPAATPAASAAWIPTAVADATGAPPGTYTARPAPAATPVDPSQTPAVEIPQWQPLSPVVDPGPLAERPLRRQQAADHTTEVTIRPGDSLWTVAAGRLGACASDVDIALEWPRIYQVNRGIIGGNPDLLRPGQVLRLPPGF